MVTSPSRLPLKATSSPAAAGRARPSTANAARAKAIRRRETNRYMGNLRRSAIEQRDIVSGAQTERRGGAGPVRGLLGGKDFTGRFDLISDHVFLVSSSGSTFLCPVSLSRC